MYRCTICSQVVPSGRPAHRVVTEVRLRRYAPQPAPPSKTKGKRDARDVSASEGWEAVRTDLVCSKCRPDAEAQHTSRLAAIGVQAAQGQRE